MTIFIVAVVIGIIFGVLSLFILGLCRAAGRQRPTKYEALRTKHAEMLTKINPTIAMETETAEQYEKRVLAEVVAWTPAEREAFGINDTDKLIDRIGQELFDERWAAMDETAKAQHHAARELAAAMGAPRVNLWPRTDQPDHEDWHAVRTLPDGSKVWKQTTINHLLF